MFILFFIIVVFYYFVYVVHLIKFVCCCLFVFLFFFCCYRIFLVNKDIHYYICILVKTVLLLSLMCYQYLVKEDVV